MGLWTNNAKIPPVASVFVDGKRYDWPVHTERPWMVEIWEPLQTKAPNPCIAMPYCCYINTVIFYLRPYTTRPWSTPCFNTNGSLWYIEKPGVIFEEWGRAETVITWHTVLELNGREFDPVGGRVVWKRKRWWMRRWARRKPDAA